MFLNVAASQHHHGIVKVRSFFEHTSYLRAWKKYLGTWIDSHTHSTAFCNMLSAWIFSSVQTQTVNMQHAAGTDSIPNGYSTQLRDQVSTFKPPPPDHR